MYTPSLCARLRALPQRSTARGHLLQIGRARQSHARLSAELHTADAFVRGWMAHAHPTCATSSPLALASARRMAAIPRGIAARGIAARVLCIGIPRSMFRWSMRRCRMAACRAAILEFASALTAEHERVLALEAALAVATAHPRLAEERRTCPTPSTPLLPPARTSRGLSRVRSRHCAPRAQLHTTAACASPPLPRRCRLRADLVRWVGCARARHAPTHLWHAHPPAAAHARERVRIPPPLPVGPVFGGYCARPTHRSARSPQRMAHSRHGPAAWAPSVHGRSMRRMVWRP